MEIVELAMQLQRSAENKTVSHTVGDNTTQCNTMAFVKRSVLKKESRALGASELYSATIICKEDYGLKLRSQ